MKPHHHFSAYFAGLLLFTHLLAAPLRAADNAQDQSYSPADLQAMLEALAQVEPTPFAELPRNKNGQLISSGFFSAQRPLLPPSPGNFFGLDAWSLGEGVFVLNDKFFDYAQVEAALETAAATNAHQPKMRLMSSGLNYGYSHSVYLANMFATNSGGMTVRFDIAGGTNLVPYDILTTSALTNPISTWTWLGLGYTSNRYTFNSQPSEAAFYILAKPSRTMIAGLGDNSVAQGDVPYGLTNALQIAAGGGHSLALKSDGTVIAWGRNSYGETNVPTNLAGVAMIAAGWYHSVALRTNGTVVAWGLNAPSAGYPLTQVPSDLTNAVVISAQEVDTLALRKDGTVVAWGYNAYGVTNVPVGLSNVIAISAGCVFNLAAKADGTVTAWGFNGNNQCTVPIGLSNVVDVAAGLYHSLALKRDGTVVAWGDNTYGETSVPVGLTNVVAIAAGGDFAFNNMPPTPYSLALKSDGTLVMWGNSKVANPVGGLNNVIAIAAGEAHGLALRTGPPTPVITLEPVDEFQVQGSNATFTTRGAGLYGVTYQWQTNSVNVSGATSAALTVTNVQAAQVAIGYRVIVSNEVGNLASSNVNLHFVTPPVILARTLPTNPVVAYQSNLTLNVAATAPGIYNGFPLTFQWQFNGSNITGATGAAYTIHGQASAFGNYSVVVSNAAGSTNAAWQVIVLNTNGLLITLHPTNQYQIAGGSVTLAASGVGINPVTYQWTFNTINLLGATNATLFLTNMQLSLVGTYSVRVSDYVSNAVSSSATFTLVTPPVVTFQSPQTNATATFQSNLMLKVTADAPGKTNGFILSYQWQIDGANIVGATTNSYSFIYSSDATRNYSVLVTNKAGGTSAAWQITPTFVGTYIAPGTLAYHLSTNAVGYAYGYSANYSNMIELANWTSGTYSGTNLALLTNAVWSTNCWLHGVQGLTATCIGYSNGYSGQFLIAMISPQHYLNAYHVALPPGTMIAFLDTNNVIYWRKVLQKIDVGTNIADVINRDTSVGILDENLPPSVGFLPVIPTNYSNYLPTNNSSYVQGIGLHQDLSLFSQPMKFSSSSILWSSSVAPPLGLGTAWNINLFSGDSSNPEMLLVGNRLVLASHNFVFSGGPNYALLISEINQQMHHLSTNNNVGTDYQLTQFSLTNWPAIQ
jgi:hypothetical protein